MKIAIGMTSYNCLNFSKLTLASILLHSIPDPLIKDTKILAVDNASTDGSQEWLSKMDNDGIISAVLLDKNYGCSKSFNEIFKRTQNDDYVILINNDIVASANWFKNLIQFMEENQEVGIGSCHPVDNQIDETQKLKWFGNPRDPNYEIYIDDSWFAHAHSIETNEKDVVDEGTHGCVIIFRRACIDAVGMFDEQFKIGCWEDIDYSMRTYRAGFKCMTTHSAVIFHHGGTTQSYFRETQGHNSYQEINKQLFMRKYNHNLDGLRTGRSMLWTQNNQKVIL